MTSAPKAVSWLPRSRACSRARVTTILRPASSPAEVVTRDPKTIARCQNAPGDGELLQNRRFRATSSRAIYGRSCRSDLAHSSSRKTARTYTHVFALTLVGLDVNAPQVRQPTTPRPIVRVAHIVAEAHALLAYV